MFLHVAVLPPRRCSSGRSCLGCVGLSPGPPVANGPLCGAHVESDDFCLGVRGMDLTALRTRHPKARLSLIEEIVAWIGASPSEKKREKRKA